jgi:phosphoglycolate phosphatase
MISTSTDQGLHPEMGQRQPLATEVPKLPEAHGPSTKPRHWEVLSFDLDGTLVDTAAEIAEAANRALEEHGIARRPVAEITLLIGAGAHELMHRLLQRVVQEGGPGGPVIPVEAVMHSLDRHYAATAGLSARPYPGCLEALTMLRTAGIRLACVTNKELRFAERVLGVTGLRGCFELVVGGDSLPEKKPHASVLGHVAAHFACSHAALAHVGDSRVDVDAARHAGVAAWAVPYGYNAGVPIEEAGPDRIFDDLVAVARFVLDPPVDQHPLGAKRP